ncbi:MAG: nitrate reductase molybdenum cofactor assembly chaperone [Actinomycetaceae bacterium]|nr:nitrate reductase molybdenum cofactor assembly chaperone [Actinomycetaceae bacterium]
MTIMTPPRSFPRFLSKAQPEPKVKHVTLTRKERSTVWMACSLLLDYPGDNWTLILDEIELITSTPGVLPQQIANELATFCSWARKVGQQQVEQHYVTTFDHKRRCALELTYYATGDTRQRGIALSIMKDLYSAVGWQCASTHLPDYLPALLELGARCKEDIIELIDNTLATHREGIEILHAALHDMDSPWSHVLTALRMSLPAVTPEIYERMQTLIRQGPPSEMVGIKDHEYLPWPTQTATPQPVPTPSGNKAQESEES